MSDDAVINGSPQEPTRPNITSVAFAKLCGIMAQVPVTKTGTWPDRADLQARSVGSGGAP